MPTNELFMQFDTRYHHSEITFLVDECTYWTDMGKILYEIFYIICKKGTKMRCPVDGVS